MKVKPFFWFVMTILIAAITFSNCASAADTASAVIESSHYLYFKNTMSISLLRNGNTFYFSIPFSYIGDYQIEYFEFNNGYVLIGDYEIPLNRNEISISAYVNEFSDDYGRSDGLFNLIYLEDHGRIIFSKMDEPLASKKEAGNIFNQYCFFILKYLSINEMEKINDEYQKGNVKSQLNFWFDLIIDNEPQNGNGFFDEFELQPFSYY